MDSPPPPPDGSPPPTTVRSRREVRPAKNASGEEFTNIPGFRHVVPPQTAPATQSAPQAASSSSIRSKPRAHQTSTASESSRRETAPTRKMAPIFGSSTQRPAPAASSSKSTAATKQTPIFGGDDSDSSGEGTRRGTGLPKSKPAPITGSSFQRHAPATNPSKTTSSTKRKRSVDEDDTDFEGEVRSTPEIEEVDPPPRASGSSRRPPKRRAVESSDGEVQVVSDKNDDEKALEKLQEGWRSWSYGFFKPEVGIEKVKGKDDVVQTIHVFTCAKPSCSGKVRRNRDSKDSGSIYLPAWKAACRACKVKVKEEALARDVTTRWNSTFDMLADALERWEVIDGFTKQKDLRGYAQTMDEWDVLRDLKNVLEILKQATVFFSRPTTSLAVVIPSMDKLDDRLNACAHNLDLSAAIRAAIGPALKTSNKYYSRTDDSELYRIAMILHPKYKLNYFKKREWLEEWIQTAREICEARYDSRYAGRFGGGKGGKGGIPDDDRDSSKASTPFSENMFDDSDDDFNDHANLDGENELKHYLRMPREDVGKDPTQWWLAHATQYPCLSRMALDYLSIPATSTDVERVFSRGRLVLPHIRNRLSAASTRAILCLGAWSLMGMVKDKDVLKVTSEPIPEGYDKPGKPDMHEDEWGKIFGDDDDMEDLPVGVIELPEINE